MNSSIKTNVLILAILFQLLVSGFANAVNTGQSLSSDYIEETEQTLSFSQTQMRLANISIAEISLQQASQRLYAPGEVKANGYTSYLVSSRVESVILRRHAILGEHVEQGQALVSLFSEAVAEAQANYRIAYADWQRAKKVDKTVISDKELLNTKTDYIAAFSRLKAYGLSQQAIDAVASDKDSTLGEYTLVAERGGAVLSDDFQQGQRVAAGDTIMVLSDETELWVEARLAANNQVILTAGDMAQMVFTSGGKERHFNAQVIQQGHTIDVKTRTRVVRLKVNNPDHSLHSGLFVDVYFALTQEEPVMLVPETALLIGEDGDWLVYLQQAEAAHDHEKDAEDHENITFVPQEVELGGVYRIYSSNEQTWQNWREVKGLAVNSHVAVTGAFFIASQAAKSGFDAHNH
ncbi:MAG: efflux RND transporter periplasmic adaptor subunit [Colwellia sp.]|nr:efflux RND transporter periplasmic adaptor subunit [Colwellia sp.]MCW8864168.1 efflux RND transporter periplasmic adaptor subunit [Colwellia sp.]MCW9082590.1 efflux RND transporter periplasmic adaptor subunit [Colwellia sp.]